jgi:chitinase
MDPIEKETLRLWILAGAPRIDGTGDACANPTTSSSASSSGSGMGAVPVATLTHPGSNEVRPSDTAVPFIGSATDAEDGALSGAALVWTSSIDGNIGTGENFSALLSPGIHTITIQPTDSDGNIGTDSVNLEMTP